MRYFVSTAIPVENGTLLREEPDQVPEVLKRRQLVWEPTPSLHGATTMTADWDPITKDEADRIEAIQRAKALQQQSA